MRIGRDYFNILDDDRRNQANLFSSVYRVNELGTGVPGTSFLLINKSLTFTNVKRMFINSAKIKFNAVDSITLAHLIPDVEVIRLFLNANTLLWPNVRIEPIGAISQNDGYLIDSKQQTDLFFGGQNVSGLVTLDLSMNLFLPAPLVNTADVDIYLSLDGLYYKS